VVVVFVVLVVAVVVVVIAVVVVVVVVVQSKFNSHQFTGTIYEYICSHRNLKNDNKKTVSIWTNLYSTDKCLDQSERLPMYQSITFSHATHLLLRNEMYTNTTTSMGWAKH
jgi:hypothetical protein